MVARRPKSCTICGVRTPTGASRCPVHSRGSAHPRPCLVCGKPSQTNYCDLHRPEVDEAIRNMRSVYRKQYKDPAYQKNKRHRFERVHGRCEFCKIVLQPGTWECDHLIPISKGGTNDITNLRILCKPCHKAKTAEDRKRSGS